MSDRVLTIPQIRKEQIVPLGLSSLYRAASEGDGPFYKVRGRWLAIESELLTWVREGQKGKPSRSSGNPMPRARRRGGGDDLLAKVYELRGKSA